MRKISSVSLYLLGLYFTHYGLSIEFDRKYFGVTFSPYCKYKDPNTDVSYKAYSKKNVETMLTVLSRRFSKVFVKDDYSFRGKYTPNITYNHGSYASLYTGEVAAKLNKKTGSKILSVWYEISMTEDDLDVEVQLVFEAANKSNLIFPETVDGIIFGKTTSLGDIEKILQYYATYKNRSAEMGVKLGAEMISCFHLLNEDNETLVAAQRNLVENSEIVTCGEITPGNPAIGAKNSFLSIGRDLLSFKGIFENINPNVQLVGNVQWSTLGNESWETVENLKDYWESANKFAITENFVMFLKEAFDNPVRSLPPLGHLGWWKLKENSKINLVDGYEEKIAGIGHHKKPPATWSETQIALVVVGVILAVLVAFSVVGFVLLRRKKQPKVLSSSEIRYFISGSIKVAGSSEGTTLEDALNGPYDKSLEIPKDKLKIDNSAVLGSGEFGCIYKAMIETEDSVGNEVAVKVARQTCSSTLKGLLSEIKIMTYLGKHPNIVALKGAYTAELAHGVVYIATELCTLGSLESFLRKYPLAERDLESQKQENIGGLEEATYENTSFAITFLDMLQWAHQIACGMEYLESRHVVHADLATRNVLLTQRKQAKLSDFGLSRRMYNYMNYVKTHQEPLPWRWMAIESLKRLEFSSKSDVWSYGITLWEIFSKGDVPYQGLSWTQGFSNDLTDGLRPESPSLAPPEVYKLMEDCWNGEPKHRPNFSELVSFTDKMIINHGRGKEEDPRYLNLR